MGCKNSTPTKEEQDLMQSNHRLQAYHCLYQEIAVRAQVALAESDARYDLARLQGRTMRSDAHDQGKENEVALKCKHIQIEEGSHREKVLAAQRSAIKVLYGELAQGRVDLAKLLRFNLAKRIEMQHPVLWDVKPKVDLLCQCGTVMKSTKIGDHWSCTCCQKGFEDGQFAMTCSHCRRDSPKFVCLGCIGVHCPKNHLLCKATAEQEFQCKGCLAIVPQARDVPTLTCKICDFTLCSTCRCVATAAYKRRNPTEEPQHLVEEPQLVLLPQQNVHQSRPCCGKKRSGHGIWTEFKPSEVLASEESSWKCNRCKNVFAVDIPCVGCKQCPAVIDRAWHCLSCCAEGPQCHVGHCLERADRPRPSDGFRCGTCNLRFNGKHIEYHFQCPYHDPSANGDLLSASTPSCNFTMCAGCYLKHVLEGRKDSGMAVVLEKQPGANSDPKVCLIDSLPADPAAKIKWEGWVELEVTGSILHKDHNWKKRWLTLEEKSGSIRYSETPTAKKVDQRYIEELDAIITCPTPVTHYKCTNSQTELVLVPKSATTAPSKKRSSFLGRHNPNQDDGDDRILFRCASAEEQSQLAYALKSHLEGPTKLNPPRYGPACWEGTDDNFSFA